MNDLMSVKFADLHPGDFVYYTGLLNPTGVVKGLELWDSGGVVTLFKHSVPKGFQATIVFDNADDEVFIRR